MRKGLSFVLGGMCVACLIFGGCGGNGEDKGVTVSSLNKTAYIQKANEVCESDSKQVELDYGIYLKEGKFGSHPTESNYVDFVNVVVAPDIGQEIEDLRQLGAPKGGERDVEAILKAREESVQIAEEDPEAVIENSDKVFAKASKVARAYGLIACATR